jgi:hypothetical protein
MLLQQAEHWRDWTETLLQGLSVVMLAGVVVLALPVGWNRQ